MSVRNIKNHQIRSNNAKVMVNSFHPGDSRKNDSSVWNGAPTSRITVRCTEWLTAQVTRIMDGTYFSPGSSRRTSRRDPPGHIPELPTRNRSSGGHTPPPGFLRSCMRVARMGRVSVAVARSQGERFSRTVSMCRVRGSLSKGGLVPRYHTGPNAIVNSSNSLSLTKVCNNSLSLFQWVEWLKRFRLVSETKQTISDR